MKREQRTAACLHDSAGLRSPAGPGERAVAVGVVGHVLLTVEAVWRGGGLPYTVLGCVLEKLL